MIRINQQHPFVHLFQGSTILCELFRGGTKRNFEEVLTHFEKVLESRPDNVAALMFMGRTHFLFARFFHFLELTDDSLKYLGLAADAAGDRANYWIVTCQAQTLLLRGDNDGALHILEKCIDEKWSGYYNVLGTLGKIHARKRLYDEAFEFYSKALSSGPRNDLHVQAAKARLHLHRREPDLALESVRHALPSLGKNPQIPASIYSVVATIHLKPRAGAIDDTWVRFSTRAPRQTNAYYNKEPVLGPLQASQVQFVGEGSRTYLPMILKSYPGGT